MSFSVLMSIYKNEKKEYLEECLSSIKNQTLLPDDIVIVIDGPVPEELLNTIKIWCEELPINIVKLIDNVGLGKALNYGLSYCKYDIVFRMDTDDICVEDRFYVQYTFLKNNPEVIVLGGDVQEFGRDKNDLRKIRKMPCLSSDIIKFSKYRNPINHMSVAFRKKEVLDVGAYQHHLFMEDYNLWLRLISKNYPIKNLNQVLVLARVGNEFEKRRRGIEYIKSELKLFMLKKELNVLPLSSNVAVFFMRTVPRILPVFLLKKLYKTLRK
ncbi:glycosyltransferase [Escherichia coli]|uniref:glycosyltransferase n=1 Tax=Escherichia coli TaxID=562 RepID=UPI001C9AD3F6|nr:glycosyltransferase [Escherichia coli]EJE0231371.1 glycosyltransferase [Escherichia coli]MBY7340900.1 glycosyltransferase [Escherichia coli]MBY7464679.1 glycosyltransferase [Escherichia coli]MBY7598367.1 glycosyltransferase [Escherichia coli]MCF1554389.1 glycosyltransferase [Escherichia coli]